MSILCVRIHTTGDEVQHESVVFLMERQDGEGIAVTIDGVRVRARPQQKPNQIRLPLVNGQHGERIAVRVPVLDVGAAVQKPYKRGTIPIDDRIDQWRP